MDKPKSSVLLAIIILIAGTQTAQCWMTHEQYKLTNTKMWHRLYEVMFRHESKSFLNCLKFICKTRNPSKQELYRHYIIASNLWTLAAKDLFNSKNANEISNLVEARIILRELYERALAEIKCEKTAVGAYIPIHKHYKVLTLSTDTVCGRRLSALININIIFYYTQIKNIVTWKYIRHMALNKDSEWQEAVTTAYFKVIQDLQTRYNRSYSAKEKAAKSTPSTQERNARLARTYH